jgi:hypothetical protein
MITAMARSSTLPRMMNALNSLSMAEFLEHQRSFRCSASG